jgi:hypothetical protein
MKGLLATIAFGAALPILGFVVLWVLTRAPWVLVAFGVVLVAVWPWHARWLERREARGDSCASLPVPSEHP